MYGRMGMSMNSLLADMLARIKNGQKARHDFVIVYFSTFVERCLYILRSEGYIKGYEIFEERCGVHLIRVDLKYYRGAPVIRALKMLSKPGHRLYKKVGEISKSYNGLGVYVLSTSKGVLTDKNAKLQNIGGELLFEVF